MPNFKLKQTSEQVQKAIDNALYPDKELTKEGVPADSKSVGIKIKKNSIHIGTEAPTNGETVWIDTDEEPKNDSTQIDVIAQPGQIIAVKEVDANGKPTKWEAIDLPKAKEPETPDFSANEGDAGYIKNRTHYVDKKGVIHKLPNQYIDAEWMATKEDGGAGNTVFIPEQTVTGLEDVSGNTIQAALVAGDVYAVEVNGVLYRCECYSYDGLLCLGNGTLIGGTGGNNEPFCVTWTGGTASRFLFYNDNTLEAPIGIKVSDWLDDIYNKLPEEFLPPVSWNNLTDRPVVDGAGEAFLTYTATFATDTAAKNGAKLPNSLTNTLLWLDVNGELVKVQRQQSGMVTEWYDEDGNKWVSSSLGGVYVYAQTAGTYTYTLYAPADTPMFDPQYLPPNLAKKADIPAGGGTGGTSIDVTAEVGQTIVVKEIDANGKPTKWESADYQPRTHWKEQGQEEIVPEFTFTPFLDESMGAYIHPLPRFELGEGKTYTVIYDGASYTCTAFAAVLGENLRAVAIGNTALAGGENTGEPFALGVFYNIADELVLKRNYMIACFDANEHAVKVIEDKIVPHKISEEYVTPSFFNVNVAIKNGTEVVLLTPWDDIIKAVMSGKNIYLKSVDDDFEFDLYGEPITYEDVRWDICTKARIGTNSLECSLTFMMTGNSNGTVSYLTISRDKNGVTTIPISGD